MNQNQRNFLIELHKLLQKYCVDEIVSAGGVQFVSNDDILQIGKYKDEEFTSIMTTQKFFDPDCDEEK